MKTCDDAQPQHSKLKARWKLTDIVAKAMDPDIPVVVSKLHDTIAKSRVLRNMVTAVTAAADLASTEARNHRSKNTVHDRSAQELARAVDALIRHGNSYKPLVKNGFGVVETGESGTRYEGDVSDGLPHGHGSMVFADGSSYM